MFFLRTQSYELPVCLPCFRFVAAVSVPNRSNCSYHVHSFALAHCNACLPSHVLCLPLRLAVHSFFLLVTAGMLFPSMVPAPALSTVSFPSVFWNWTTTFRAVATTIFSVCVSVSTSVQHLHFAHCLRLLSNGCEATCWKEQAQYQIGQGALESQPRLGTPAQRSSRSDRVVTGSAYSSIVFSSRFLCFSPCCLFLRSVSSCSPSFSHYHVVNLLESRCGEERGLGRRRKVQRNSQWLCILSI